MLKTKVGDRRSDKLKMNWREKKKQNMKRNRKWWKSLGARDKTAGIPRNSMPSWAVWTKSQRHLVALWQKSTTEMQINGGLEQKWNIFHMKTSFIPKCIYIIYQFYALYLKGDDRHKKPSIRVILSW